VFGLHFALSFGRLTQLLFISSFHKVQGVTTEWSTTRKYYLAIMAAGIVNSGQLKAKEAETVPLESTIKKVCFGFLLSFHLGELHQSEVWFGHSYCASILISVFP
jgi:hypothetical protein